MWWSSYKFDMMITTYYKFLYDFDMMITNYYEFLYNFGLTNSSIYVITHTTIVAPTLL